MSPHTPICPMSSWSLPVAKYTAKSNQRPTSASFLFCELFCTKKFDCVPLYIIRKYLASFGCLTTPSSQFAGSVQELAWALTISNEHLGCAHLFWRAREFNNLDAATKLQLTSEEEPRDHSG